MVMSEFDENLNIFLLDIMANTRARARAVIGLTGGIRSHAVTGVTGGVQTRAVTGGVS